MRLHCKQHVQPSKRCRLQQTIRWTAQDELTWSLLGHRLWRASSYRLTFCRGVSHNIIEELVDSPSSPFFPLGLARHQEAGGYARALRRQVGQLRRLKADPHALALPAAPDWGALFSDPSRPLVTDLGCGAGRYLLLAAAIQEQRSSPQSALQELELQQRQAAAIEAEAKLEAQGLVQGPRLTVTVRTAAGQEGRGSSAASQTPPGGCAGQLLAEAAVRSPAGSGAGSVATCSGGGGGGANFLGVDVRLSLTSRATSWAHLRHLNHRVAFLCANANASLPLLLGSYGSRTTTAASAPPSKSAAATDMPKAAVGQADDAVSASSSSSSSGGGAVGGSLGQRSAGCRTGATPAASAGSGRVALVCLQFSDPPVRREALVGGDELVAQLAEALEPGALVWIQSDVRHIADSLRDLFWRHGGFAPSARHACATSATRTQHWLPAASGEAAAAANSAASNSQTAAADTIAATPGRLPLLLQQADLTRHQEPWLTEEQVAEVAERHRNRMNRLSASLKEQHAGASAVGGSGVAESPGPVEAACGRANEEGGSAAAAAAAAVDVEACNGSDAAERGKASAGCGTGFGTQQEISEPSAVASSSSSCPPSSCGWQWLPWLDSNPLGVPTEREVYVERGGRSIYRLLLVRR